MKVIVGLGNFGDEYAHTRHNAGCDALNVLAQRNGIPLHRRRFRALVGEGRIGNEKVVLAFPLTYMNDSGQSVAELLAYYKPRHDELIVIYDDVDLPEGALRVRAGGGPGTHNGMRSVIACTGFRDFPRIRVGIGAPPEFMDIKDYVLGHYPKEKRETMFDAFMRAAEAAELIVTDGVDKAMCRCNGDPAAKPRPKPDARDKGEKKEETPNA